MNAEREDSKDLIKNSHIFRYMVYIWEAFGKEEEKMY